MTALPLGVGFFVRKVGGALLGSSNCGLVELLNGAQKSVLSYIQIWNNTPVLKGGLCWWKASRSQL